MPYDINHPLIIYSPYNMFPYNILRLSTISCPIDKLIVIAITNTTLRRHERRKKIDTDPKVSLKSVVHIFDWGTPRPSYIWLGPSKPHTNIRRDTVYSVIQAPSLLFDIVMTVINQMTTMIIITKMIMTFLSITHSLMPSSSIASHHLHLQHYHHDTSSK